MPFVIVALAFDIAKEVNSKVFDVKSPFGRAINVSKGKVAQESSLSKRKAREGNQDILWKIICLPIREN